MDWVAHSLYIFTYLVSASRINKPMRLSLIDLVFLVTASVSIAGSHAHFQFYVSSETV